MRKVCFFRPFSFFVFTFYFSCLSLLGMAPSVYANNVTVTNVSITGQDATGKTSKVQFDITWDNSWRNAANYDAAWVFVKYSTDSGTTWKHATLKANDTNPLDDSPSLGWSYGSNSDVAIVVPTDKKGAFIQRTALGAGTLTSTGVQFVWDWGSDNLSDSGSAITAGTTARLRVFAVEMVYVPTGSFSLGSGGAEGCHFYKYPTQTDTYTVSSAGAITIGTTSGNLSRVSGGWEGDGSATIPADFPNGYNAFYVMKYEISEEQWVDFFNTLTDTQKTKRDITGNDATHGGKNADTVQYRNAVSWSPGGAASTTLPYVVCSYLCWTDLSAYADWACLRPFTELEYEKACRGSATPVANEYSWGSTAITDAGGTLVNDGAANETTNTTGEGLCSETTWLRCGFAATSTTTRSQAGATYYGAMDMTGSLFEGGIITVRDSTGRAFTGLHGDGVLDSNGEANVTNWPAPGTTDGAGLHPRGGSSGGYGGTGYMGISGRVSSFDITRQRYYGGRFARTAP